MVDRRRPAPEATQVDDTLTAATDARGGGGGREDRRSPSPRPPEPSADAELAAVHERLGDREQLRSFEKLVDRHDTLARGVRRGDEARAGAEAARVESDADLERRREAAATATEDAARADDLLAEATAATAQARETLERARHAEMAHALRGSLAPDHRVPCAPQPVATLPPGPARRRRR